MKKCSRCQEEKELADFVKNKSCLDGFASYCKKCRNSSLRNEYASDADARQKRKDAANRWASSHKEEHRLRSTQWAKENREKRNAYMRGYSELRRKTDILYRLSVDIRTEVRKCLRSHKNASTFSYVGCSVEELLEKLGPIPDYAFHLDHVCPLAQASTVEELKLLWHHSNLRWFPASENISKGANWTPEGEELCRKLLGREWIHA